MLINEASRRTGFSKDTIRYYERVGLIEPGRHGRGRNNYRRYGRAEIERLMQVKMLKDLGFTLREIRKLFRLGDTAPVECSSVGGFVDEKISNISAQIDQLKAIRTRLETARRTCTGNCEKVIAA